MRRRTVASESMPTLYYHKAAEATEQFLAGRDIRFPLYPFAGKAVDHAENSPALSGLGDNHLDRISGGTEDATDLRHHLDCVEDVHRIGAAQEDDKRMPGGERERVLFGQLDQLSVGAAEPHQARP